MRATVESVCTRLLDCAPGPTVSAYVAAGHALIGSLVGSADGHAVLAVRMKPPEGDPLKGFRPLHTFIIGTRETQVLSLTPEVMRDDSMLIGDPGIQRVLARAGHHRVLHDPDPRTDRAMRGSLEERFWRDRSIGDRLKVVHALDEQLELHLCFDRFAREPRFDAADTRVIGRANRSLGPWVRRVAFLHGHGPGLTALSGREREALSFLLSDAPQKLLHGHLGLSDARGRELVRSLYGKLGVIRRIELMTRWMSPANLAPCGTVVSQPRTRQR